jgi:hypothetical protein
MLGNVSAYGRVGVKRSEAFAGGFFTGTGTARSV